LGLTAEITNIDLTGGFKVKFSQPIYQLKSEAVLRAVDFHIVWMSDFSGSPMTPAYSVEVLEVSETDFEARLLFDDPSLVSKGAEPDQLNVWFREPKFFVR